MSNVDQPFPNYNREIIVTQPNKNKPAHIVNIRESSIETMYYKKHIDVIQYQAGSDENEKVILGVKGLKTIS